MLTRHRYVIVGVLTRYGQALQESTAWNYFTPAGVLNAPSTLAKAAFESALATNPAHPLALHLGIHLLEPATDRGMLANATANGDALQEHIEQHSGMGIGHLVHMPGHAYLRVGRYADAAAANVAGIADDTQYLAACAVPQDDYYRQLYYCHKHAFLVASATISGQSGLALGAAGDLQAKCNIEYVARNLGGVFFSYPPWQLQVLVQFGRWKDILALPMPLPYTTTQARAGAGGAVPALTSTSTAGRGRGHGMHPEDLVMQYVGLHLAAVHTASALPSRLPCKSCAHPPPPCNHRRACKVRGGHVPVRARGP